MKTKKVYIPVIIKTEADLPKEGKFWIHQKIYEDSLLNIFDFSTPHRKLWEKDIDWYLLPVDLPTDKEIDEWVNNEQWNMKLRDCKIALKHGIRWFRDKLLNR